MRLFGLMPTRNEADRYLHSAICNALEYLDELVVYDDRSNDDTVDVALNAGAFVVERPAHVPSFVEHEGKFRQAAYDALQEEFQPEPGDWILAIDADEALVNTNPGASTRMSIELNILAASYTPATAILVPVPEFFGLDADGRPLQRMDGEWGRIQGTRLFAWQEGGVYADRAMACGAEPTYVATGRQHAAVSLHLTHWGYVSQADREVKYRRYSTYAGHSNKHVESIPASGKLRRWPHAIPSMHRGDELGIEQGERC